MTAVFPMVTMFFPCTRFTFHAFVHILTFVFVRNITSIPVFELFQAGHQPLDKPISDREQAVSAFGLKQCVQPQL
jgi:hypothetical protein